MTLALIRKLLRDSRWALLAVALLLFGFQMIWTKATQRVTTQMAPMFQAMAMKLNKRLEDVEKMFFSGPGRVMQSVIGGDQLKFQNAQDVLSIGYVHPLMQILFCLWAIGRASGAIAGEIERGTMELLLAQPLPRSRVIVAHLCVDLLLIPVLCLSLWAGLGLGSWLIGPLEVDPEVIKEFPLAMKFIDPEILTLHISKFGPPLLNVAAFLFAVSGLTMAISAGSRSRWRVIGFTALIIIVQFIANIIGQIWDTIAFLRPFTVFYYYQPQQIALRGAWSVSLEPLGLSLRMPMLLVLFGVGTIGYLIAWRVFTRRDLPAPL
jgi:ABC-2 type transport system permease protein